MRHIYDTTLAYYFLLGKLKIKPYDLKYGQKLGDYWTTMATSILDKSYCLLEDKSK